MTIEKTAPQLPWETNCRLACYALMNKMTMQHVIDQVIARHMKAEQSLIRKSGED